jgi:hypothetical protein
MPPGAALHRQPSGRDARRRPLVWPIPPSKLSHASRVPRPHREPRANPDGEPAACLRRARRRRHRGLDDCRGSSPGSPGRRRGSPTPPVEPSKCPRSPARALALAVLARARAVLDVGGAARTPSTRHGLGRRRDGLRCRLGLVGGGDHARFDSWLVRDAPQRGHKDSRSGELGDVVRSVQRLMVVASVLVGVRGPGTDEQADGLVLVVRTRARRPRVSMPWIFETLEHLTPAWRYERASELARDRRSPWTNCRCERGIRQDACSSSVARVGQTR